MEDSGEGVDRRVYGIYGVLMSGAGKQGRDNNRETVSRLMSIMSNGALTAVGSFLGKGSEIRDKEGPRPSW